ncbi:MULTISPECIES: response regulator [unclassified Pedobacter]|uniref:response regulator n=1 Tax=unclassified Pedobacter TaxID=2628915 RepID=UPI001E3232C3|nr:MULTISPECIES: response regulator [unclassified Pedobacter]
MNRKILVIDDDPLILLIHEAVLETQQLNCCLEFFDDAGEAILFMEKDEHQATKFLLLLDINMPLISGWDLLDEIQNSDFKENVAVVMVTSSVNEGDRLKAKKYDNVLDFISKPLKDSDFNHLKSLGQLNAFFKN